MTKDQTNRRIKILNSIIILFSIIGLILCIAILLPQVRQMIMSFGERILHKESAAYQSWYKALLGYASGGIFFILFFDYCILTASGKMLVQNVKQEIKDCLSEIDFRSFVKPVLLMFGVYLLGILTIIRSDFSYLDDLPRSIIGYRMWFDWSRYVSEFVSIFIHADTNLTDISPVPQLIAILILSVSSVFLVYIIGNRKITFVRLLASVPVGLFPFFLECLAFKFDAPYMAISVLASIVPFLFIDRRKAFFFCSIASLLIMCMTYQAASGIYPAIVVILCFRDWNNRKKSNKEVLSFLGTAAFTFCFVMLFFKLFLMKPDKLIGFYASTAMHPASHLISGALSNIKDYVVIVNHDLGMIWKMGIALVLLFFVIHSIRASGQKSILSFFVSILVIGISFVLSYGVYTLLAEPLFLPRGLIGFGVLLAVLCIYVVSDYKKIATLAVLALNWCFFVFAFSYGNALADQARYAEFRTGILLHDLSILYPDRSRDDMTFQLNSSIDYAPSVKNIAKHYPVIERLVPKRLGSFFLENYYYLEYFNYSWYGKANLAYNPYDNYTDFNILNLPVVFDSYYHTIQSDGEHLLITLKH